MSYNTLKDTIKRIFDKHKTSLSESTTTADIAQTRPNLIGVTRTPTSIIFPEIALLRPTNSTINTILAITYLDKDLNDIRLSPYDLSGDAGILDTNEIKKDITEVTEKGQYFRGTDNVIYKSLYDDPTDGGKYKEIIEAVFANRIRQYSDSSKSKEFEQFRGSESRFIISRWDQRVGTRKTFASITNDLMDDINAQGLDADGLVSDLLLSASSEGINKDVIQKLIAISSKYVDNKMNGQSIVDLSSMDSITDAGRELHYYATELAAQVEINTHYSSTYIVASSRAVSLLVASGWMLPYDGEDKDTSACVGTIEGGRIKVYKDTQTRFDYMVAGFVHDGEGSIEGVGSLVVTPYTEDFGSISDITIVPDPNSRSTHIQMMLRYGIGTNPYTVRDNIEYDKDEEGNIINSVRGYYVEADDWENLTGKSLAAWSVGLKLPRLVIPQE